MCAHVSVRVTRAGVRVRDWTAITVAGTLRVWGRGSDGVFKKWLVFAQARKSGANTVLCLLPMNKHLCLHPMNKQTKDQAVMQHKALIRLVFTLNRAV